MYDYTDEADEGGKDKGNKADTTVGGRGGGGGGGTEQYQRLRDELLRSKRAIQVLTGQDAAVVRMFMYIIIEYTSTLLEYLM